MTKTSAIHKFGFEIVKHAMSMYETDSGKAFFSEDQQDENDIILDEVSQMDYLHLAKFILSGKNAPKRACGRKFCCISTGICDSPTFGYGALDHNGYWKYGCSICARAFEAKHPEYKCWPQKPDIQQYVGDFLLGKLLDSLTTKWKKS